MRNPLPTPSASQYVPLAYTLAKIILSTGTIPHWVVESETGARTRERLRTQNQEIQVKPVHKLRAIFHASIFL